MVHIVPFAKSNGETQHVNTAELRTPTGQQRIAEQLGFETFELAKQYQDLVRTNKATVDQSGVETVDA